MHKVLVHFGHDGQGEGGQIEAVVTTRWEGREVTGAGRGREGEEREGQGWGGEVGTQTVWVLSQLTVLCCAAVPLQAWR